MKIDLRLFSVARDLAGFERRMVEMGPQSNAGSVLDILSSLNPEFKAWAASLRLAINREYVESNHPLKDGDEVAVIPPVSGG